MPNHYYNPFSATGDPRSGMGYGKSQKIPSANTGLGSTYTMGWDTGIYPPEVEDDEDVEVPFEDEDDLRSFLSKVNLRYRSANSGIRSRTDFSSYASSANRFSTVGLSEQAPIATMKGMVSIPAKVKYPSGLGMATGGSSSEFGATRIGPGKVGGDGTQFGYSRKTLDLDGDGDMEIMSLIDILDMTDDERNFLKHQRKIKNTLTMVESLLNK